MVEKIALVTCYAPNSYEFVFFQSLPKIISEMADYEVIFGGDMNVVNSPLLFNYDSVNGLRHLWNAI